MATVEHCIFCFESLASHLQDRKSLTLQEVQKFWAEYEGTTTAESKKPDAEPDKLLKQSPAIRRVAASSSSASSSTSLDTSSASSSASSTTSLPQTPPVTSGAATPATSVSSFAAVAAPSPTESPLFVTWNTVSRHGTSLRGCIGTFESQPLEDGLSSYALIAALQDYRFNPITARELPTLEVAVTLLTDFEDCDDAMDWELGTHGLRISFYYHGRKYGSTYLPDVATEQGWTKEETLVSLMRKAGWEGRKDKWRDVNLKVVRYQGRRVDLGYPEYKRWRDWVDKKGLATA
jgi:AMME syndrome candidate gene 1 protein